MAVRGVNKGVNSLFGWLTEEWIKRWPTVNELEVPKILWFTVDEGIQRLRQMGILEWICHVKPGLPHWDNPENVLFTNTLQNRFVSGALASPKIPVAALLSMPGLTVGTTVNSVGNLRAMGMAGS